MPTALTKLLLSVMLSLFVGAVGACSSYQAGSPIPESPVSMADSMATTKAAVAAVLDRLHQRAAAADFDGYFQLYRQDAVFLGTDRAEYWPLPAFKAYTQERFHTGTGWTYQPTERFIHVSGNVAWFEERLLHRRLGETRGTGVLVRENSRWLVAQYNLTLPIPNDLMEGFAQQIQGYYEP